MHARGELDLSAKAGPEFMVLGLCGVDHLHSDTEAGWIETGVDGAHAARAETADDPVGTDSLRVTGAGRLYPPLNASDAHRGFVPLLRWSAMRLTHTHEWSPQPRNGMLSADCLDGRGSPLLRCRSEGSRRGRRLSPDVSGGPIGDHTARTMVHDGPSRARYAPGLSQLYPENTPDSHSWGARGRRFKSCRPDFSKSQVRGRFRAI